MKKNIFIYFFLLQIFGILFPWCLVCCDSHHDQSRSCHWKCLRDHVYFYILCNRIWPSCGTNFCKFFFLYCLTIYHTMTQSGLYKIGYGKGKKYTLKFPPLPNEQRIWKAGKFKVILTFAQQLRCFCFVFFIWIWHSWSSSFKNLKMQQPQNNFSYSISILSNIYKPGHNLSFDTFIREIVDFSRELIVVIVNNLLLELEQRHVPLRHLLNAKLIIYFLKDLPSKK